MDEHWREGTCLSWGPELSLMLLWGVKGAVSEIPGASCGDQGGSEASFPGG